MKSNSNKMKEALSKLPIYEPSDNSWKKIDKMLDKVLLGNTIQKISDKPTSESQSDINN